MKSLRTLSILAVVVGFAAVSALASSPPPLSDPPTAAAAAFTQKERTMSYSFQIRAANKAEAKQMVNAVFKEVNLHQACHKQDEAQALAAASAFIDLVADDDTKDVVVSMNGSLSGKWSGGDLLSISGASVSVTAGQAARPPAATA